MNIGIMGWDHEEFESLQLTKVSREMGHDTLLFSLQDVNLMIKDGNKVLQVLGRDMKEFDLVISRAQLRPEHFQEDYEVLQSINDYISCLIDSFEPFVTSESKLLTYQKLQNANITIPDTFLCTSLEEVKAVYKDYSSMVAKPSYGFAGTDVEKIEGHFNRNIPVLKNLIDKYGSILLQEYIPHPEGDIRITTLGDETLVCFKRVPNEKTWKANVGMGASIEEFDPPQNVKEIGLEAATSLGLLMAGVDIVHNEGKYYIFEVNNCPGWYPMKENGERVARKVVQYCVDSVKRKELIL